MGGFSLFDRENPPQIQSGSLSAAERRSVQILHPFIGSVQQYVEELADPDRYRPDHCPQCEAHRPLTAHGFYSRTLVDAAFDGSIPVRRYLCRCCKRRYRCYRSSPCPTSASASR